MSGARPPQHYLKQPDEPWRPYVEGRIKYWDPV
jgi:hypothetical protein